MAKVLSICLGLFGSICLVFMLLLPSQGELMLCAFLLPLSLYIFRLIKNICLANLNAEFAPILAKKYTAIVCAFCACLAGIYLVQPVVAHSTLKEQYDYLLTLSNVESLACASLPCKWLKEALGFMLLKKAVLDLMFVQAEGTLMYSVFVCLYAFGHLSAFTTFSLLCQSSVRLDSEKLSIGFMPSLLCLLVFSFIFSFSSYFQTPSTQNILLSSKFLTQNTRYIELYLEGIKVFIDVRDLDSISQRLAKQIDELKMELDGAVVDSVEKYFAHKDFIVEGYSQWYFSVYGEYTRLLYSAFGKGEQIAQEQFIELLKAYTPFDLQSTLDSLYDEHLEHFKNRIQQSLKLFSTQIIPSESSIESHFIFDDFAHKLDLLAPRQTDGVSAILGASVVGGLIAKSSGKFLSKGMQIKGLEGWAQKSAGQLVGKNVAKRGMSSVIGTSGSAICGAFAPLCAIGVFALSDYALNKIDQVMNEEEFKSMMKAGIKEWELQLKNSLTSYNSQLSEEIFQLMPFETKPVI